MGSEPSNTASEAMAFTFALFAEGPPPEEVLRAGLTDDFLYEDRRSGWRFPDADAETYPKVLLSIWETGAGGQPQFRMNTLAVRGERFAAIAMEVDYGNGMAIESIHVFVLNAGATLLQREIDFDLDDMDGALAELDRLHALADES